MCNAEWYGSSCKPIVLECALPRQENVRHSIQLGLCATRHSEAQVATCEVVPIVLCILRAWKKTQTSTLNPRASVRARGRDPDVTGASVQIIAPAWACATKQRASANRSQTAARKPWRPFWSFFPRLSWCLVSSAPAGILSAALEPSLFMIPALTSPNNFRNWWCKDCGTDESEDFLWTRLQFKVNRLGTASARSLEPLQDNWVTFVHGINRQAPSGLSFVMYPTRGPGYP